LFGKFFRAVTNELPAKLRARKRIRCIEVKRELVGVIGFSEGCPRQNLRPLRLLRKRYAPAIEKNFRNLTPLKFFTQPTPLTPEKVQLTLGK